ncbi:DUF397 domain-containing protein [Streptomyces sp. NPDC002795]|uniref:DUF397 domain-containing protein n=1 Tax=Streptomyces sp. NPDC002795 TaxID=3364665 RepID=UPI00367BB787
MIQAWAWRKSSRSAIEDCVEVACTGTGIRVRDSKRRRGHVIAVAPVAWDSFLELLVEPGPSRDGRPVAEHP